VSSGCCRSPGGSTVGTVWTGAAAMPAGDVVVVVDVVDVVDVVVVVVMLVALDCRAMTWTPPVVPVVVGTDGEVGSVTVPAPCRGTTLVVVVGGRALDLSLW
jgi:hypothetical protein